MGNITTGILFAVIAAIGWGASAVLSRIALEKTDPRLATIAVSYTHLRAHET